MPAANVKWKSSGTGALGTAANYDPAQVPVDDDWVWFDTPGQAIASGWDQSSVDLDRLIITEDFTESFGDATNYVYYSSIAVLRFAGQAAENNKLKTSGSIATALILNCLSLSVDAEIGHLFIQKGTCSFLKTGSGAITRAYIGYRDGLRTDVVATFASTITITDLRMFGGAVETNGAVTTAIVADGTLTHKGSSAIATLIAIGRSKVIYEATAAPTIMVVGPYAEVNFSTNAGPLTLGLVVHYDKGILNLRNGKGNIALSASAVDPKYMPLGYAYPLVDEGTVLGTITL
jgi:hypothetical protein